MKKYLNSPIAFAICICLFFNADYALAQESTEESESSEQEPSKEITNEKNEETTAPKKPDEQTLSADATEPSEKIPADTSVAFPVDI